MCHGFSTTFVVEFFWHSVVLDFPYGFSWQHHRCGMAECGWELSMLHAPKGGQLVSLRATYTHLLVLRPIMIIRGRVDPLYLCLPQNLPAHTRGRKRVLQFPTIIRKNHIIDKSPMEDDCPDSVK